MRDEGPGIAAKDCSYCIWGSQEKHQAEGLKKNFVSSKRKVSKEKGRQKLATLFSSNLRPEAVDII